MNSRLGRTNIRPRWLVAGLGAALLALAVVACGPVRYATPNPNASVATVAPTPAPTALGQASTAPSQSPGASPNANATPTPEPLTAAAPTDPFGLLAWAFTPIFQLLFMILVALYALTGNALIAIVLLTLLIRLVTVKLSSRQIVSQQRMMRLQPELRALQKEIQHRSKGDRQAVYQAQQQFYKERGVSPTAGCLPSILQMGMLIPMYSVIRIGLTNFNPTSMLEVFGVKLVPLTCPNPAHYVNGVLDKSLPCINTVVAGLDMGKEQVLFGIPFPLIGTIGISAMALVAVALQFVQSRQMLPPAAENDPSASTQRSMMIFMPLIYLAYGAVLPTGVFVYYIVSSLFSIVQQFLIVGWGQMFPLFGWTPAFARSYQPRFPVTMPDPVASAGAARPIRVTPTVRPNTRRQSSRRGRRR